MDTQVVSSIPLSLVDGHPIICLNFLSLLVLQLVHKKQYGLLELWEFKMVLLSQLVSPSSPSRFSGQVSDSSLWSPSVFSGITQHLSTVFKLQRTHVKLSE